MTKQHYAVAPRGAASVRSPGRTRFPHEAALRLLATVLFFAVCAPAVHAQRYPAKPVRVVVPNTAGSLLDVLARQTLPPMSTDLGQTIFVENLAGAGGAIGTENVAKAAPDGYTLLAVDIGPMTITPAVYSRVPYEPVRDFAGISMLGTTNYALLVHSSLGVKNMDEFVKLAKSRPGTINYSSGGNGHAQHMLMELFQEAAGVRLYHVPYKGGPAAMQALISGEVGANLGTFSEARPHIQSGRIVALGVGGDRDKDVLPGVPDLAKLLPKFSWTTWFALFAPAGTPQEIIGRVNAAVVKVLASAELKAMMAKRGFNIAASSPAEVDRQLRTDLTRNRELVKRTGMKVD